VEKKEYKQLGIYGLIIKERYFLLKRMVNYNRLLKALTTEVNYG